MTVLVTGAAGQLGYDVMNALFRRGHTGVGSGRAAAYAGPRDEAPVSRMPYVSLDITDAAAVGRVLAEVRPDAVIHCAGWTDVDAAEEPGNLAQVRSVNVDGTRYLAHACKALGCKMLYVSTDYVFDGMGTLPWKPDWENLAPQNVYGQSKLDGELAVSDALDAYFIVRIAWLFGRNGKNFVKTMLNLGKKYETVRVVNDQIGTPTYSTDLARLLADMIETDKYGYYHATNEGGYISWCDFAREIFRQAGYQTRVIGVSTAEYGANKAVRPFNSRLDRSKLTEKGFEPLPTWQDALSRYLKEGGL